MMDRIYLDWNATSPTHPKVIEAMVQNLQGHFGNPSSVHQDGQRAKSIVEIARRRVAAAMGGEAQGIIFYSGATEANNTVLHGLIRKFDAPYLVSNELEHPSVYYPCKELRTQANVQFLPANREGDLDLEALSKHISLGCNIVSIMLANNEIGNINDIKKIVEIIKSADHEVLLHVDATQGLGRIPINFKSSGADVMTVSFHKCGGPKGIGAALLREGLTYSPLLYGGQQERGRRPGTENVVVAAGVSVICELVNSELKEWHKHCLELKNKFIELIEVDDHILRVGREEHSLPNTLNYRFTGVQNEDMLLNLDLEGVSVSAGSACSAGSIDPSHVLIGMGYNRAEAKESLRISFGPTTTFEELELGAEKILSSYKRIKQL